MDVEHILRTLNSHGVEYILAGGMNFLLNHTGPLSYEVGLFINDTEANRSELNFALQELGCAWGPDSEHWKTITGGPQWLDRQPVFCLTSPHGAIDIFRAIKGLEDGFEACKNRAEIRSMQDGEMYYSLSDEDMLRSQLALPETEERKQRIETLRKSIETRKKHVG